MRNRHLNIFRPFSQKLSNENIEDNLSRALVHCLQNNSLLFHEFLRTVFYETEQNELFQNLLSDITDKDAYSIDIQVETTAINESFSKVFALTMSGVPLDMQDFVQIKPKQEKRHRTDIFIAINDIAVIIEVKRDKTDCRHQLYQQVAAFTEDVNVHTVFPLDFNWPKLMQLINRVVGFQTLIQSSDIQLKDFIDLIQSYNPNWIPVPPLASTGNSVDKAYQIRQRVVSALKNIKEQDGNVLDYTDRIGLELHYKWAKEMLINLRVTEDNTVNLAFGIWPGNTKGQGSYVLEQLKKNKDWVPPNSIIVNGKEFNVKWGYELKFCHFNRYVTNIIINDTHLKLGKNLISGHVHWGYTGKYDKERWNDLETFLDDYLIEDYNWREKSGWRKHFLETGRNYLTLSIGYEIETIVPVAYLQTIDTEIGNLQPLSDFIENIERQYKNLFL
ncbi:hypothetical protein [Gelidibacter gilvus]|uniref:PD-(D/E)XK nuclease family protein n=1 Tax=Gelidibacter gilvus TaxID=59602 RepID=A0A4Q0XI16_9FLAO|nr:hypothetical protein [Gelidibacter gilvus]RXJ51090.1 hypothetical protein ESZ48_04225 [Gelidibacter gilvus]